MARKKKPMPKAIPIREFKSPIEMMLRNAICGLFRQGVTIYDYSTSVAPARGQFVQGRLEINEGDDLLPVDQKLHIYGDPDETDDAWDLYGEVQIGPYRTDFIMRHAFDSPAAVAVECDGHEFHDRTKQQAAYDRSRDRALASMGLITLRFTGSEIHHSAERCVGDLMAVLHKLNAGHASAEAWSQDSWRSGIDIGFARGVKHAAEAYSINLDNANPEEHW